VDRNAVRTGSGPCVPSRPRLGSRRSTAIASGGETRAPNARHALRIATSRSRNVFETSKRSRNERPSPSRGLAGGDGRRSRAACDGATAAVLRKAINPRERFFGWSSAPITKSSGPFHLSGDHMTDELLIACFHTAAVTAAAIYALAPLFTRRSRRRWFATNRRPRRCSICSGRGVSKAPSWLPYSACPDNHGGAA
jgi:hypothetical protein